MKLYVRSELPVDPATCWGIFESETYRQRLEARAQIRQEVLEERTEGSVRITRIRTEPDRELPGVVAKLVGASKLCYVQENRYDADQGVLEWKVQLEAMPDRVDVSGRTTCTADGDGCVRVVDGEITVRVRLIGGQIERAVVAEFERSMARAVEIARELIEEGGVA